MADTNQDKRTQLKERFLADYKKRVEAAGGNVVPLSLGDEALDMMVDFMLAQPKETTRTKTFRFPAALLEWLEAKASDNSRSPNAELIELLRNAKQAEA